MIEVNLATLLVGALVAGVGAYFATYLHEKGKNLATRQHERVMKHKGTSFEQVVRAAREYREKYPGKAVICSGNGLDPFGWAQLFGGASLANVPCPLDQQFRAAVATMKPIDPPDLSAGQFALGNGKNFVFYSSAAASIPDGFTPRWIDIKSGQAGDHPPAGNAPGILWLIRQ